MTRRGPPALPTTSNWWWQLRVEKGDTGAAGISASGGVSLTVACTDNGTVKAGELPRDFEVKLLQGAADVTASASWSIVDPAYVSLSVLAAGSAGAGVAGAAGTAAAGASSTLPTLGVRWLPR